MRSLSVVLLFLYLSFVLSQFEPPDYYYPSPKNWPQCSGFFVTQGDTAGYPAGAPLGDIDGDGYDDFAFQESNYAFVFFGNDTFPSNIVIPKDKLQSFDDDVKMITISGLYRYSDTVLPGGDVNGDGFSDFLILDSGRRVVVVFGGPSLSSMDLSEISGAHGFVINCTLGGSESVHAHPKSIGDINNDGFEDLAIATTPRSSENGERVFTGYVLYGSADPTDINLMTMDNTRGFKIVTRSTVRLGYHEGLARFEVKAAGDVNNDGFGDILVGFHPRQDKQLEGFLVYGAATNADIDLSAFPQTRGSRIIFPGRMMRTFGAAGDLNGDKIADFFVQADIRVFVVYGKQGPQPFNLDLTRMTSQRGLQIYGTKDYKEAYSEIVNVEVAGDVNADGYDDLLVGFERGLGGSSVYVIYGGPKVSSVDVSSLTSTQGWDIKAERALTFSKAGDINGDGYRDIIFQVYSRSVLIVFGGQTANCVTSQDAKLK